MQSKDETPLSEARPSEAEDLPYRVELWRTDDTEGAVERILGRAASAQLARAIFNAAAEEHPGRKITLRKGDRIVVESETS